MKKLVGKQEVLKEQVGRVIKCKCDEEKDKSKDNVQVVLYIIMELCGKCLSGNALCMEWLIQAGQLKGGIEGCGIDMIYFGVKKLGMIVGELQGCTMLTEVSVKWEHVVGWRMRFWRLQWKAIRRRMKIMWENVHRARLRQMWTISWRESERNRMGYHGIQKRE